ncbi:MAG: NUDIX domain-containing protein [Candidatus Woesebacteria bacterium]
MENEKISQPNNTHTEKNPVGRFMVAVGAVIVQKDTGKILITQRASSEDWHPNEWEITYGRIDQHEGTEKGLKREVSEENGIDDLAIKGVLRVWHIYRGPETAENELIGITYVCETTAQKVSISHEHQAYRWVTPEEALELISVEGIRKDIENYIRLRE